MEPQQITNFMLDATEKLSALESSAKAAHKRLDAVENTTNIIHKLTASVESLAAQVKTLAERMEDGLKSQGERIGALEKEPGKKWKALTAQIIQIVVAAVLGGILVKFVGQ